MNTVGHSVLSEQQSMQFRSGTSDSIMIMMRI